MNADYMLACGIVWRKTADPVAGWELIEGLDSPDPHVRQLAQTILVECGEPSMNLLESAIATGTPKPGFSGRVHGRDSAGASPAAMDVVRISHELVVT